MEQTYNYTQNNPSYHRHGLKNHATELQQKADTLNTTATGQSDTELVDNRNNDIKGDRNKGSQLTDKANSLKNKAQALNEVAQSLEQAAKESTGPLEPLKVPAQALRDAAKKEGPSAKDHLFGAANELESGGNDGLEPKANNVITKFGEVKTAYDTLMDQAKRIHQETHPNVTNVTTAYNQLKEHYDKILNLTKLAKLAKDLTGTLQEAATELETNVKTLRDTPDSGQNYTNAQTVILNYERVETAYNQLSDDEKQPDVENQFEALKTLYNTTFKFTKIKHYSDKLSTAATGTNTANVADVINNYQKVAAAYNALDPESQKRVQKQFYKLQDEYSEAIYQYKWYLITLLTS